MTILIMINTSTSSYIKVTLISLLKAQSREAKGTKGLKESALRHISNNARRRSGSSM